EGPSTGQPRRARPAHQRPRDLGAAADRLADRRDLAATVAMEDDVVGQHPLERLQITVADGGEKASRELVTPLLGCLEAWAALVHVPAGTRGELAGVVLLRPDDGGDLGVRV